MPACCLLLCLPSSLFLVSLHCCLTVTGGGACHVGVRLCVCQFYCLYFFMCICQPARVDVFPWISVCAIFCVALFICVLSVCISLSDCLSLCVNLSVSVYVYFVSVCVSLCHIFVLFSNRNLLN